MAREIIPSDWEQEVLQSEIPVLVDIYTTRCGPCKMLAPLIAKLGREYDGRAKVLKMSADDGLGDLDLQVSAVPLVLIYSGGKELERIVGIKPEDTYKQALSSAGVPT